MVNANFANVILSEAKDAKLAVKVSDYFLRFTKYEETKPQNGILFRYTLYSS